MKILAIIPARGGSKRLPGKNIKKLNGKPLIAWTIEAALKSKYISDVIVSTDDIEIANVSEEYGADVPFMRPQELSSDKATSIAVVEHAINFSKVNLSKEYDFILLLQPTSPLRISKDIDNAIELLVRKKADSIVSMCECEHSPLWSNTLPEDHNINDFDKEEIKNQRSQDLPTYYRYNGAIYLSRVNRLLKDKDFSFRSKSYAYIMPMNRSVDIDNELDFLQAEILMKSVLI